MNPATIGAIGTIVGYTVLGLCVVALIAEAWWLTRPSPRAHVRTRKVK